MVIHPAALDLPHALVEWVTMLVVTREGDRRCKLRPSQRAMVALVSTRAHHSGEDRRRVRDQRVHRPLLHPRGRRPAPERAPGLLKTLREHDPEFILLDGTLAECDRVGDGRADYSHKHRRHGVNVQVVTDPCGRLLWLSPALPGASNASHSRNSLPPKRSSTGRWPQHERPLNAASRV